MSLWSWEAPTGWVVCLLCGEYVPQGWDGRRGWIDRHQSCMNVQRYDAAGGRWRCAVRHVDEEPASPCRNMVPAIERLAALGRVE